MPSLVGSVALMRLITRLERARAPIWIAILGVIPMAVAGSFAGLYPDPAAREQLVATLASTPALTALLGPAYGSSIGALTVWRIGTIAAVLVGLLSAFMVIRHTRGDEEASRRELLGSTVIGRHSPLTAAVAAAAGASLLLGLVASLGLVATGQPLAGSFAFGLVLAFAGLFFAGLAAVAAQLTERESGARAIAGTSLGLFFTLRMVANGTEASWLSWASPIGWGQRVRPFAGERWEVLVLFPVAAAALVAVAYALASARDVGAGVIAPRAGPASAGMGLGSPMALGWRLQRRSLFGWTVGLAGAGVGLGSLRDGFTRLLDENPELAEIFERLGGERAIGDAYLTAVFGILGLVASAYAIGAVSVLHVEEESLRAEAVLATATTRWRWAASHLIFAALAPAFLLAAAGITAGIVVGAAVGDIGGELPRTLGAALVQLPAVWVLAGVTMAVYGIRPRWMAAAWGALVVFLLLGQLGGVLQLSPWALDISPFTHVPKMPGAELAVTPLVWLAAVSIGLATLGLVGLRRRDVG